MAQAVETAVSAVRPGFQAQGVHGPVEQPADGVQGAQSVFFFREKHIVFGAAKALRRLVFQHGFVNVHRLRQADRGCFVALDFGRREPQVIELARDDFDVFVFQLPNVAGAQKGVDHEADQPIHFQGHAAVDGLDVKPGVGLVPHKHMVAQHLGLAQHGRVLGDGESAARFLRHFHLREQGHLLDDVFLYEVSQHFAQLRDVADDGGRGQLFVGEEVDELLDAGGVDAAQIGEYKKFGNVGF